MTDRALRILVIDDDDLLKLEVAALGHSAVEFAVIEPAAISASTGAISDGTWWRSALKPLVVSICWLTSAAGRECRQSLRSLVAVRMASRWNTY